MKERVALGHVEALHFYTEKLPAFPFFSNFVDTLQKTPTSRVSVVGLKSSKSFG